MALSGKIAVVTGAAMGIGKAITEILLQNGAKVALLDVNETAAGSLMEALNKQHGQDRALFLNCNVESEEQMKAAFQKTAETFGGIDILCNNAGIMNENMWEKTVSINLMGVIRGTYLALEYMSKMTGGQGGVIVNTASVAATKNGVVGFTRAMAAASAASGYGIRINALCPGFVQTDLLSDATSKLGRFSHLADVSQQLVDKMGILNVSEVAESFLELVTDETKNGDALLITPKGKKYVTCPSFK
ncbi:15-hydroxyprostaglandin dehydrogenase [NAD(+)]-like isoform X2 [Toxotes jaculatrix]|uniref:15-hydroxyprostaglandin dehydrogenase [NAD(+)]-like isoform X2 n=1 Tax=Toxotes jaculatrix TaxID=941984 RepID=UPI001B3B0AB4|nr:15-hydroxyprostaglandin dehydrogenase [NAD(+)]-like isoform X2 [Toxotes jaculatrix]